MRRTILAAAICFASLFVSTARAVVVNVGGDDGSLPVADQLPLDVADERSLIAIAHSMPSVRTAIHEFESRGYIARPEADRATRPTPGTDAVCFLAYEKPGYVAPTNCIGAPVIMVGSMRRSDGVIITRVSAGFVMMDRNTGTWRVADPKLETIPGMSATDAPFDAEPDRFLHWDDQRLEVLSEYAVCAGIGNLTCVAEGVGVGMVATPWVGVGVGLICVAQHTRQCLTNALARWPH